VYFSEVPFTYKDGNVQTFYTIVSSQLSGDGSRYSELDFEYLAADKWGIAPDQQVMYMTSWNRYIANPWQAWKRYFYSQRSWQGWHTCVVSATDGVNVKFWIDGVYFGAMSTTDNDGSSVYPRNPMQVAFANWIWNNVIGSSTANRTTTMQVDWTLFYKDQEISPAQVDQLVATYRSQGLQRRNLAGQTYITNPCTVPGQPGTITGNTSVAAGSSQTYSIASVPNATSYTWTLPSGWSGSSTSTSITTTAGTAGGTISVRANNSCGSGTARSLSVSVAASGTNIALNKAVAVSSTEAAGLEGSRAVDGNASTRWASAYADPQWIYVDLGQNYNLNRVRIVWEAAYGRDYRIEASTNASTWSTLRTVSGNTALTNDWTVSGTGRYVRIYGTARGTQWGYSIFELQVFGTPATGGGFSLRVEAENYLHMAGLIKETCSEGGQNLGSFDASDWSSYNITIPSAGQYNVKFRVSSIYTGRTLRFEKDNGATLLATVTVPNTGNWQSWTDAQATVTLPAGTYAVGLTTFTGGLNINWFEIASPSTSATSIPLVPVEGEELEPTKTSFYPNPARTKLQFSQQARNLTIVEVIDSQGNVVLKTSVKQEHEEIDVEHLKAGTYFIRITNEDGEKVERMIKE
jgi:hypothetical protein